MTDIRDLLDRSPDVTYTDDQAVADGVLVDLPTLGVHVFFEAEPITRMSSSLFDALAGHVGGGSESEQASAYQALLSFLVAGAIDVDLLCTPIGEGEATGHMYQSQHPFHALGCKRVWLQRNGRGFTVMLPEDY
ncbi:MAG: hypothetical protein LC749_11450 [Actinobacteria bacterium]|nr:hypothetical protein [Actinomycetota bacterium]